MMGLDLPDLAKSRSTGVRHVGAGEHTHRARFGCDGAERIHSDLCRPSRLAAARPQPDQRATSVQASMLRLSPA